MHSSILSANQAETKDSFVFTSETKSLAELLSYIETTVEQLIDADDETRQYAYDELKESLKIVYTLNCLHPNENASILQVLDECYSALVDAIERNHNNINILQESLSLFSSGRNYEPKALNIQSLEEWTNRELSNKLKLAMEANDADLIYIQNNVLLDSQENVATSIHTPSRLIYSRYRSGRSSPKILIIRNDDSTDYRTEAGVRMRLGGKDHGKISGYVEGEVKDKNGNYAQGKVSKESDEDGYDCDVKAGKDKKKK